MATIAEHPLTLVFSDFETGGDPWPAIAREVRVWAHEAQVDLRDAVLLLPFAQVLPLARRAFAASPGWLPRIETTSTLARSLGPAAPAEPGLPSFDRTLDRLSAAQWLRSQAWGGEWARRDARGFRLAVAEVVDATHALLRAAEALAPERRAAFWQRARELLAPAAGPGATQRLLARVALEWASAAPPPATDALFASRPSAWVQIQAGGDEPLVRSLLEAAAAAGVPCLRMRTDPADDDAVQLAHAAPAPTFVRCDSLEHEARCTAAQVLEHLRRGEHPVALVAEDRLLVRRVRALLERREVALVDETGWTLSTTRAAARVTSLLGAAAPDAETDALLDWLKTGATWPALPAADAAVSAFEAALRRASVGRVAAVPRVALEGPAAALWSRTAPLLGAFAATDRISLGAWLERLARALDACGARAALDADDAGRRVLAALRLDGAPAAAGFAAAARSARLDIAEFTAWVHEVLEAETYRPTPAHGAPAQVFLLPLARVMLRPFAALVLPGADDRHLGAPAAPPALFSDALAAALGLPDAAQRRRHEAFAFTQALRVARITLLRRRRDGPEPLSDSPLVEQLALRLQRQGRGWAAWTDPQPRLRIEPTPITRPAPPAAALLPARLSASACEALRACPYRFFALHLLRLREDEELDDAVEKRDYGTWLHAVLHRFHAARAAPAAAEDEVRRLHALARTVQAEHGLADDRFLPFAASFERLAPAYVDWLQMRDALGWRWRDGEIELRVTPPALDGVELRGIVDRIDERADALELIDYKTGSAEVLKETLRDPQEDTQLAFYAALVEAQGRAPPSAIYLALDGRAAPEPIEHPDVAGSAQRLVRGLADDLRRLRAGAGLPALGEGVTCAYCAARGLCRKDHWSDGAAG